MASIEYRRNARTGEEVWRVRFRHEGSNKAKTFVTEADAEAWRTQVDVLGPAVALRLLGEEKPTAVRTVTAQIRHHVEHLTGITDGTRRRYFDIINKHLDVPPLNAVLVSDLTRDHVAAWVNAQRGAPKSIHNRHALLSAALTSAERDGMIASNVAKGIRLPRVQGSDSMTFLTVQEFGKVLAQLDPYWWPVPLLLAGTGCRWGEATALTVADINLDRGDARIHRAWKETGGSGFELGETKTARSRRTVTLSPEAIEAVRPLCTGRRRDDYVLTNRQGGPLHDWWRDKVWKPAVARALPERRVRVHDLRHTYASWAIQDGISLPALQRQLGHESITTTVDTYGHLVRSDFDAMAAANGVRLRQALEVAAAPVIVGEILA